MVRSLLGLAGTFDAVVTGDAVYVRPGVLATLLGAADGKPWLRWDAGDALGGTESHAFTPATVNPDELLAQLRESGGTVTDEGREDIRGVSTAHYRTTYALDAPATGPGVLDAWIDDDGVVRQVRGSVPSDEGTVTITATLFDLGQPVTITVPPADQVGDGANVQGLIEGLLHGLGG
jgi:hypothetical protein